MPSLQQKQLESFRGERLKVFLVNGKALTGQLIDFDENTMIVGPTNEASCGNSATINLKQVAMFRRAERGE